MKYILKFNKYIKEGSELDYTSTDINSVRVATESLNDLIKQIGEFNSKKSSLEKLILNNRGEDRKDISKNIEDIVGNEKKGTNKFLSMYVSIVDKMRRVADKEDKIEYYKQLDSERKGDLSSIGKLSDASDREDQRNKLTDQLNDISNKMKDMEKEISELEKEILKDKKELTTHIKELEKKFREDVKKTKWSIN